MTDQNFATSTRPHSSGVFLAIQMFASRGLRWLKTHRSSRISRAAFMNTVYLDDALLRDIGVTREEVKWAAGLPLSINAAQALHRKARVRRAMENNPTPRKVPGRY
ncbi:MAG: hypothetical protein GY952_06050 [Rhodobacteraceae bacterium]|nr:hypothetical protein [Paracoccaceae bacterium]